jgi:hypothetical protein
MTQVALTLRPVKLDAAFGQTRGVTRASGRQISGHVEV